VADKKSSRRFDVEDEEALSTIKDSQYYAPLVRLMREVEIMMEGNVIGCPAQEVDKVVECRFQLEGTRKAFGALNKKLILLNKYVEKE